MPAIDEVEAVLDQLERLLSRHGVQVAAGSRLEDRMLFVRHVRHVRRGEAQIQDSDDRPWWREMHGIYDLGRRIIEAEAQMPGKFERLQPWIRLFASTRGQLAQTAPATAGDQESDKVFELLVALALLPHIEDIAPDRGSGRNPDLLFRFRGQNWGIACKRLYSASPATFRDRVTEAIRQIEVSPAEIGLVFVSLVNLMKHDVFWPLDLGLDASTGMSRNSMLEKLNDEIARLEANIVGQTDRDLVEAFHGMKAMPGIVHYLATTYLTGSPSEPVQKTVQNAWRRGRVGELLYLFQNGLNATASLGA
jgi:hypothetical protein